MEYNWDLNKLEYLKEEYRLLRLKTHDLTKEDKCYCLQKEDDLNVRIEHGVSNKERNKKN